jgi:hypothetical protein
MARPPSNVARHPQSTGLDALPTPTGLTPAQVPHYERLGGLMLEAAMLAPTDLPMLESAARVQATLEALYADPASEPAMLKSYERLHQAQLVQLGLTPAARRQVQKVSAPEDPRGKRIRGLLK